MSREDEIERIRQLVARLRGQPKPCYIELPWIERAAWIYVFDHPTEGGP